MNEKRIGTMINVPFILSGAKNLISIFSGKSLEISKKLANYYIGHGYHIDVVL